MNSTTLNNLLKVSLVGQKLNEKTLLETEVLSTSDIKELEEFELIGRLKNPYGEWLRPSPKGRLIVNSLLKITRINSFGFRENSNLVMDEIPPQLKKLGWMLKK